MKTLKIPFILEKQTQNTYRYFEANDKGEKAISAEQSIGTLYVKKSVFPDGKVPDKLTVTIQT